jgi:hypothetical protein
LCACPDSKLCMVTQVFPSLNPARREDVVLLQAWLKDTMAQLTAEVGDRGATTVQVLRNLITGIALGVGLKTCWHNVCTGLPAHMLPDIMPLTSGRLAL